jgi:hypothetical protein
MRKFVSQVLQNHHAPDYQVYGALEAMLKKFGTIYTEDIQPEHGGLLWYWKLLEVNHIAPSE